MINLNLQGPPPRVLGALRPLRTLRMGSGGPAGSVSVVVYDAFLSSMKVGVLYYST